MIEVKRPELLNASLGVVSMLHPTKGTLKLSMDDVSEATLTLEDKAEAITMHQWVKLYNQLGFVGYFRRTSRGRNIGNENSYTLKHGIDILQDSVWDDETTFEGTKTEFLTALLNKQTSLINGVKPWVLGSCADTSSVTKDINYDNLMDLFRGAAEEGGGYYFTYNQSVWPWQVSLVAKPSSVESEFRLERNMDGCQIKDNDAELCTRLYLSVNAMEEDEDLEDDTGIAVEQNASIVRVYNNTTAQAAYGIIVKTADIDISGSLPDSPSTACPEADDWAADFLARRAEPMLQIEISGLLLKDRTGSSWDESRIGTQVRVALPDYATAITERCVTVNYPDLYADPERVTVSLANSLPTFTNSVGRTQRTVAQVARAGRGSARKAESFDQHFKITDNSGNVLKQAGLHLDAQGMLVYADDNVNMIGSRFNVQADKIGMVVGTNQQGNYIKAGEITLAINRTTGESTALVDANHVNISGTSTAHLLAGSIEYDADGNLVLKESSGGGIVIQRTESGVTTQYGVFDQGTLTAGVIATIINGVSSTYISGDYIYIGTESSTTVIAGKASASEFAAVKATVDNLTGNTIVESYVSAALVTGTTVTANNTFVHNGDTIYKRAMRWTSGGSAIATVHALGDTTSIILNHSHAMSVDSSGVVTVGDAQTTQGTFNIADTAFYKAQVASAWNSGGATAKADQQSQYAPFGGSVTINIQYVNNEGVTVSTGRSVTIWNTDVCPHKFGELNTTNNGTYYPSTYGYSGFSKVIVNVPDPHPTKHEYCVDSLNNSGTHSVLYVPDNNGITLSIKVRNISDASKTWYWRTGGMTPQDMWT